MTVPEAGAMLGLSRPSAYEAVKRGDLPVIRIGRRLVVSRKAIERMLERGTNLNAESADEGL